MGSEKKKKKRNPSLRKSSLKQIESSPLGLGWQAVLLLTAIENNFLQNKVFFHSIFLNIAAEETNSFFF